MNVVKKSCMCSNKCYKNTLFFRISKVSPFSHAVDPWEAVGLAEDKNFLRINVFCKDICIIKP